MLSRASSLTVAILTGLWVRLDVTNLKGEQVVGTTGLWVFLYVALAAPDVRITSGLTSLQCAMLINTFNGVYKNQNDRGEWSCISPEGQQFKTAKEMGIRLPSSNRP